MNLTHTHVETDSDTRHHARHGAVQYVYTVC